MTTKRSFVLATALTVFSLSLAACSDSGDEEKGEPSDSVGAAFCKANSPKILALMSPGISELFQEAGLAAEDFYSRQRCETLFAELSFCEPQVVDTATAFLTFAEQCLPLVEECNLLDDCMFFDDCEGDRTHCLQWNDEASCTAEYEACTATLAACPKDFPEDFEKQQALVDACDARLDICTEAHSPQSQVEAAMACVGKSYTPAVTLESFAAANAASCGFETSEAFIAFARDAIKEGLELDAADVAAFEAPAASLAACLLEKSGIPCSEVRALSEALSEEAEEPSQEVQDRAVAALKKAADALYQCPDELLGVGALAADKLLAAERQ